MSGRQANRLLRLVAPEVCEALSDEQRRWVNALSLHIVRRFE
jgi:hypothetical protein